MPPSRPAAEIAAVFAGGFAGAVARAVVADAWAADPGRWPWATFVVNLTGAFLLGWWLTGMEVRGEMPVLRRGFLATGVCGALTTFSTLQLEVLQMLDDGAVLRAVAYVAASVMAGLAAVAAGTRVRIGGRAA